MATTRIISMHARNNESIATSLGLRTDYIKNPDKYNSKKYLNELEKVKTRGLTTFYYNSRDNKDFQEFDGKQYNPDFEYGGKVLSTEKDKYIIEIRNRLQVGDTMEIIVPGQIESYRFMIDELWDYETDEKIEFVNPGKQGQKVKMKLPIKCDENWILRRKKA